MYMHTFRRRMHADELKKVKKIPIGLIQKGIEACRLNALAYLSDARKILSIAHPEHAYVSVQLAIEELGKAIILKKRAEEAFKKPGVWHVEIEDRLWTSHKYKTKKAWELLDPKLRVIHKRLPRLDRTDTVASHSTRLECAYVEFHEESQLWWLGPVVDEPKLEKLIENVEEVLHSL